MTPGCSINPSLALAAIAMALLWQIATLLAGSLEVDGQRCSKRMAACTVAASFWPELKHLTAQEVTMSSLELSLRVLDHIHQILSYELLCTSVAATTKTLVSVLQEDTDTPTKP